MRIAKFLKNLIYFVLIFLPSMKALADDCNKLKNSEGYNYFLNLRKQIAISNEEVWPGYRFEQMPLYFGLEETPHCVAFFNQNSVAYVPVTQPVKARTEGDYVGTWEMLRRDVVRDVSNLEVSKHFIQTNLDKALFLQEPLNFLERPRKFLKTALHESFHLFAQHIPEKVKFYRDEAQESCLNNIKQDENLLLFKSFISMQTVDRTTSDSYLKEYCSAREARYKSLDDKNAKYCRDAESYLERLEGSADYYAWETFVGLGLISKGERNDHYAGFLEDPEYFNYEPYYYTGAMLLSVAKHHHSDIFEKSQQSWSHVEEGFDLLSALCNSVN